MVEKFKIDAFELLQKVRSEKPMVHHLTNWVTIYDCANIVKVFGGSPVMAHAPEEVAQMASLSSSLVLNIGTLTSEFVRSMKIAAASANKKGIPVTLDVCGAGATEFRDKCSFRLLDEVRIDIIKGNCSEIARIAGEDVRTKGVDAQEIEKDMLGLTARLALKRKCVVVATGKEDIVNDGCKHYLIKNGHPIMAHIVGTGCMAASVIGTFAAVHKDLAYASCAGLVCFEVAAELAAQGNVGPAEFKLRLFDSIYKLDKQTLDRMQQVEA